MEFVNNEKLKGNFWNSRPASVNDLYNGYEKKILTVKIRADKIAY